MRIAVGGFMHESNTFLPVLTRRRQFEEGSFTAGDQVVALWGVAHHRLDCHGNLPAALAGSAEALVGYQTYPHIDQRERGLTAAQLLSRTLRGEIRPVTAIAKPALIVNILGQATDREPMRSLLRHARDC